MQNYFAVEMLSTKKKPLAEQVSPSPVGQSAMKPDATVYDISSLVMFNKELSLIKLSFWDQFVNCELFMHLVENHFHMAWILHRNLQIFVIWLHLIFAVRYGFYLDLSVKFKH